MAKRKKKNSVEIRASKPKTSDALATLMSLGIGSTEKADPITKPSFGEIDPSGAVDFDITALIDEAIQENEIVSRDLRIDDSHIPRAKNFLDWCINKEFLGISPFLEQALWGIRLFGEFCPHCTDMEWMSDEGHAPNEGIAGILENVQMLEFGECPSCGAERYQMLENGELDFYYELVVNAGQRCVTGDTRVLTDKGIERIGDMAQDRPYGFSDLRKPVFNGQKLETTSDFYKAKPEALRFIKLSNSYILRGTPDHPIWTLDGFKRLEDITDNSIVPVYTGQNCWGTYIPTVESLQRTSKEMLDTALSRFKGKKHPDFTSCIFGKQRFVTPDLYKVLGLWVAEGRNGFICNTDPDVNAFVYSTLTQYLSVRYVRLKEDGVGLYSYQARAWLASLLDCTYSELKAGSACKRIPNSVLQAPKEYVAAFLQGLFEGDGSASKSDGRKCGSVGYASLSRELIYDVYVALSNFGIFSKIRKRKSWATNGSDSQVSKPYWCLSIPGDQVSAFDSEIGFFSERKIRRTKQIIERNASGNCVPHKHTSYQFLKDEVYALLQEANSQLNTFELSREYREDSEKFRTFKSKKTLGLYTVFGRSGSKALGCRWDKLFKSDRCLTKSKLRYISESLLEFKHYLSDDIVDKLHFYHKYTEDNVYLLQVAGLGYTNQVEETYDFTLPETHQFITEGVLSHNSGKSFTTAMLTSYLTHIYLMLQKPQEALGIDNSTVLHGTFVALTAGQAKENLFDYYINIILESPWFQEYHKMLKKHERQYGIELFKVKDTFLSYKHRRLLMYPSGPDKRILRGRTRFFGAIDELGWFDSNKDSGKVKINAHEVYTALANSLETVRNSSSRFLTAEYNKATTGYMFNISSPSHARDKIMELTRKSEGSTKILAIHKPTWEINPNYTREGLAERFRLDFAGTMRDFGAQPPLSSNPFIGNKHYIEQCLRKKGKNLCTYGFSQHTTKRGTKERYAYLDKVQRCSVKSIMAIDAGYSNNSFSLVVGSIRVTDKDFGIEQLSVDCLVEINPLPGVPLSYTKIFQELIVPLAEARNVTVLLADQWNSIKLLQDAENDCESIKAADKYSLKYTDLWDVKSLLETEELSIPRPTKVGSIDDVEKYSQDDYPRCFEHQPVEHLILQMMTVQDTGKHVIKGEELTDDLWRAMALMCWGLQQEKYLELLEGEVEQASRQTHLDRIGRVALGTRASTISGNITIQTGRLLALKATRR